MPPPQKPELVQAQEVKASADTQMNQQKLQADVQKFQAETERLERLERIRAEESYKEALLEAATKLLIANKQQQVDAASLALQAQQQAEVREQDASRSEDASMRQIQSFMAAIDQMSQTMMAALTAPKTIVRDPTGKVVGMRRG
jgi:hypothetical protein